MPNNLKKILTRAGEMAQWLRALAALAEDSSSFPVSSVTRFRV